MSKDEIGKQLEEFEKYVKEQERQEKLREKQSTRDASAVSLPENFSDDYDQTLNDEPGGFQEDEFLPENSMSAFTPETTVSGTKSAASNHSAKKNGCGCGCFSFIFALIFIFGAVAPALISKLKRSGNFSYTKTVSSQRVMPAMPAQNTQTAAKSEEDFVKGKEYYTIDEIINAMPYMEDEKIAEEVFALANYREELQDSLTNQFAEKQQEYSSLLPDEAKNKRFASAADANVYFSDLYYNKVLQLPAEYSSEEKESVRFYMNYSALDKTYSEVNQKINDYIRQYYRE